MIYRKATFDDVEQIFALVNDYASDGIMLARSRNTLFETLRDMIVAVDEETNEVVGVGGLHIVWDRLAEVRTMAVSPAHTRKGIGAGIVTRLLDEGRKIGITKFFTLTYKPGFFQTLGFHTVAKETMPPKVWKDCIDCPKFPNCDEIALIRDEGGEEEKTAFHL